MNSTYTKKVRAQLRQLVELIYQRHLQEALLQLDQHFIDWKAGKIDAFTLEHKIHQFHQGPSRELYKHFATSPKNLHDIQVAHALIDGVLKKTDVPQEVMEVIAEKVDWLRKTGL